MIFFLLTSNGIYVNRMYSLTNKRHTFAALVCTESVEFLFLLYFIDWYWILLILLENQRIYPFDSAFRWVCSRKWIFDYVRLKCQCLHGHGRFRNFLHRSFHFQSLTIDRFVLKCAEFCANNFKQKKCPAGILDLLKVSILIKSKFGRQSSEKTWARFLEFNMSLHGRNSILSH